MSAPTRLPKRLPKINGTLGPIYKQLRQLYDPARGQTIIQEWESAGLGLTGIASLCLRERIAFDHTVNQVRSRLLATSTGPQAGSTDRPVDSWQLLANELHTNVKQNPVFGAFTRARFGQIQSDADQIKQGLNPDISAYTDLELALLDLLVRDQLHYAEGQYVLKHTANVSLNFLGYAEITGEESLYTSSLLIHEINHGWTTNCPAPIQVKILLLDSGRTAHENYLWSWRKLPSTDTTSANNRRDISYEYWYGEWSTVLYNVFLG